MQNAPCPPGWAITISAAVLLLLSGCAMQLPPAPATPAVSTPGAPPRVVVCHYMSWFRWAREPGGLVQDHWSWNDEHVQHDPMTVRANGLRDVCSVCTPRISTYDSRDPDVLDYHLLSAKLAGISAFVVDWYGADSYVDRSMKVLFDRAEALGMQVGVCLEEKTWFTSRTGTPSRAAALAKAVAEAAYVLHEYGKRPGCWRLDGRPVLLVFAGSGESPELGKKLLTPDEWAALAQTVTAAGGVLVRQDFNPAYASARNAFAWCGDERYLEWYHRTGDAFLREGKVDFYLSAACPGFDDSATWGWGNGVRVTERRDGATFQNYWRYAVASHARAVQVVTWNDFAEGTVIEPTAEFGTQYLDLTEKGVGDFTQRPVDLTDNDLPYQWYVLTKRAGASYQRRLATARADLASGHSERARQGLAAVAADAHLAIPPVITAADEPAPFSPAPRYAAEYARALALVNDPANVVTSERLSASSTGKNERPPAACGDHQTDTRWASTSADDQWLQLALPAPVRAGRLAVLWEQAYAATWNVEVSADGQTWEVVATHRTTTPAAEIVSVQAPQPFRYLRLHLLTRATQWGFSLWELAFVPK